MVDGWREYMQSRITWKDARKWGEKDKAGGVVMSGSQWEEVSFTNRDFLYSSAEGRSSWIPIKGSFPLKKNELQSFHLHLLQRRQHWRRRQKEAMDCRTTSYRWWKTQRRIQPAEVDNHEWNSTLLKTFYATEEDIHNLWKDTKNPLAVDNVDHSEEEESPPVDHQIIPNKTLPFCLAQTNRKQFQNSNTFLYESKQPFKVKSFLLQNYTIMSRKSTFCLTFPTAVWRSFSILWNSVSLVIPFLPLTRKLYHKYFLMDIYHCSTILVVTQTIHLPSNQQPSLQDLKKENAIIASSSRK